MRQTRLRAQVGRPEVEAELRLELVDRRLVHATGGREPADEVDQRAQRRARLAARRPDHAGNRVGVEQVGLHQLEPVARGQPLEVFLADPRHHDAPSVGQEAFDDRGAQAAGAAGDQRRAIHVSFSLADPTNVACPLRTRPLTALSSLACSCGSSKTARRWTRRSWCASASRGASATARRT